MYEAQTYESILARMLQKALSINSNLDTREGSLVWYGDAPRRCGIAKPLYCP